MRPTRPSLEAHLLVPLPPRTTQPGLQLAYGLPARDHRNATLGKGPTMQPTISDIALVVLAVVGVVALFHGFGIATYP